MAPRRFSGCRKQVCYVKIVEMSNISHRGFASEIAETACTDVLKVKKTSHVRPREFAEHRTPGLFFT